MDYFDIVNLIGSIAVEYFLRLISKIWVINELKYFSIHRHHIKLNHFFMYDVLLFDKQERN